MSKPTTPYFTLEVRDLRALLFEVDDQNMTIRELKQALSDLTDQHAPAVQGLDEIENARRAAHQRHVDATIAELRSK